MKLTPPQTRLLTLIVTDPIAAQVEIDAKLSARNVVANLVKASALMSVQSAAKGITSNGNVYIVTKAGYDATGINLNVNGLNDAQRDVLLDVIDTEVRIPADIEQNDVNAYVTEMKGNPIQLDAVEQINEYRYAGSDDRPALDLSQIEGGAPMKAWKMSPEEAVEHFGRVVTVTEALPMPEIDPADEPIEFIPVQFVNPTVSPEEARNFAPNLTFPERAITLGLPNKIKNLMIGTGVVGSATWKKNAHKATEDPRTGVIVCECNIKTKSRKLQSVLHKTTRIIPTVTEV